MAWCSFRVPPVNKNHALVGLYSRLALLARPPSAVRGAPCFYRESGDLFMLCLFIIPVPARKINRTCSAAQSGQSRSPRRKGEGWWSRELTFSVWEQNSYDQKSGISLDVRCAWQCVVLCAVIGCNRVIWSVPQWADRYARSRLRGR